MSWTNSTITNKGAEMLIETLVNRALTVTSAVGGTGTIDASALADATDVVERKQTLKLLGTQDITYGDGKKGKKIGIQLSNLEVEEGYLLQQIAVFARLDNEETDTLLFIMQNETGIEIPSSKNASDFLFETYAIIGIDNDAKITVIVDPSAVASVPLMIEAIRSAIAEHNNDPEAHGFKRHVIATRTRDPGKPHYGLGGGGDEAVALDTSPYTGTTEIGVVVSGTEYDADNLSENRENAKSGTLIIKKMEE